MNLNYILISLNKHSRIVNKFILFLLAAAVIGCGKEARRTDYVARVNNSYLTEKDLEKIISSTPGKNFYRNEIIRNWINREILFQQAVQQGITNDDEYVRIIEDSKKELAASMLLEEIYNESELTAEENELEEFFNLHKEEFRLTEQYYLINKASFSSENDAVVFRTLVLENNWETAIEDFSEEHLFEQVSSSLYTGEGELHPSSLLRVVKELYPGEISIVINSKPGEFTIVQMLQKYSDGSIPPKELIKESLKRRLIKKKKDELIKNYIKELYSGFEIEIRQK